MTESAFEKRIRRIEDTLSALLREHIHNSHGSLPGAGDVKLVGDKDYCPALTFWTGEATEKREKQ